MSEATGAVARRATGSVLLTLASAQFLMTLDSSVMNVSIATVAHDVGTTVTGIQSAITLYTLVMAMCMVTGGKVGSIIGRKRAFAIGCVIYGLGSGTTAIAPNLAILIIGWSVLEGIGAALILPAIVALVAGNFPQEGRPRAYGLVMAAGAIAIAIGPLLGGLATTYATWRLVFAGEVLVVVAILFLARGLDDPPVDVREHLDLIGAMLSAAGLGAVVFGILRAAEWGLIMPKAGVPEIIGLSPVVWLELGGLLVLWIFMMWEARLESAQREPLIRPAMFTNRQLTGGLVMFFFQYLIQMGVFFTIPLFLSVALGLSAIGTGLRITPLSITLLLAAAGIPKFFPSASPRFVVQVGLLAMLAGTISLFSALEVGAGAEIVTVPLLFIGAGIGALASQLGSVAVSAVPDDEAPSVGGLQNTATNLGASVGTALAGSVMIAVLTTTFLQGVSADPAIPDELEQQATVQLASGVPFASDAQIQQAAEDAGATPEVTAAVVDANGSARVAGLRAALAVLAVIGVVALFFTRRIPRAQPGEERAPAPDPGSHDMEEAGS
jgi:MFS family permease